MALVLADRVQEYSTTTGTGTLTLSGAYAGFQTFAAGIGNGNTCYYTITSDTNQWEIGIGTVGVGTLARTTLISSSTGSLVSFVGTLTVFVTYPAEKSVNLDASNVMTGYAISGGTINGTTVGATTVAAGSFSTLNSSGNTRLGGLSGNQSLQVNNVASAVNYAQVIGGITTVGPQYSAQGTDTNINLLFATKGTGQYFFNTGGGLQFGINSIASAVNYLQAAGAATGGAVGLNAQGTDTNVNMGYFTKGSGFHFFYTNGNAQAAISNTASAVNYAQITGAATGAAPTLSAQGSDTNIGLVLSSKGTGVVALGGSTVANSAAQFVPTASGVNYLTFTGTASGSFSSTIGSDGTDSVVNINFRPKSSGSNVFYSSATIQAIISGAAAVNYLNLTGAATGNAPTLSVAGSDANISLVLTGKGTGVVALGGTTVANSGFSVTTPTSAVDRINAVGSTNGNAYLEAVGTSALINFAFYSKGLGNVTFGRNGGAQNFLIASANSSVNYLSVASSPTGVGASLSALGSDTDINIKLIPKGTGTVQFGTHTAGIVAQAGYITITDAGGTSRRLLVG